MKTSQLFGALIALGAVTAAGSISAEVGIRDGSDQFAGFTSTQSKASVQDELNEANRLGTSGRSRIDGDEQSIGHFTPCRTTSSVQDELVEANAKGLAGRNRVDGDDFRIATRMPSSSAPSTSMC